MHAMRVSHVVCDANISLCSLVLKYKFVLSCFKYNPTEKISIQMQNIMHIWT